MQVERVRCRFQSLLFGDNRHNRLPRALTRVSVLPCSGIIIKFTREYIDRAYRHARALTRVTAVPRFACRFATARSVRADPG